jgi:hypothetical protein
MNMLSKGPEAMVMKKFLLEPNLLGGFLAKLSACLFLFGIAIIPIGIVLQWSKTGAVWVVGYSTGILTLPFVALGALRSIFSLFDQDRVLDAFLGFTAIVIAISVASIIYALT